VGFSLRTQRLRLTWTLVFPFLWLAQPTPRSLLAGALLALPGLLLRAAASGHILKDRILAVAGPYASLRHPLYLGSFLTGAGMVVAGGRWILVPVYVGLFVWLYGRTIRAEEEELALRFGEEYGEYRRRVPAFLPRRGAGGPWDFRLARFLGNKEWEAGLGFVGGLGLLWLKMVGLS
jgi:protein-S-isoprenylcysteine O-methyltransferase Ste14